ncbi:histidine phosphatase family protein [Hydrogenophaga sp.]|uniref:histidine phosphatase family protein n=1 Tax=Hydrogenophaga sp. TaxID=1904254 RepID=UPI0025BC1E19|nr:histidine phosphatase family protein [Hydrogenophaga sp.]
MILANGFVHSVRLLLSFWATLTMTAPVAAQAQTDLWTTIQTQPNIVLVGRHMDTGRGVGTRYDPSGQCEGEVMLSAKGRRQAEAMGRVFQAQGVGPERLHVVASAMCRMRDTAMLAFGKATLDPALRESFSGGGTRQNEFLDAAEAWARQHRGNTPLLLLTHHPNIDALTGEQPDFGQVVVTQSDENGGLVVLGVLRVFNPGDF